MEPRIQYAKTDDGVDIAYWTLGDGQPLVHIPLPFSHIQLELQIPEMRRWYEALAREHTLVRYDHRGFGLAGEQVAQRLWDEDLSCTRLRSSA